MTQLHETETELEELHVAKAAVEERNDDMSHEFELAQMQLEEAKAREAGMREELDATLAEMARIASAYVESWLVAITVAAWCIKLSLVPF